MSRFVHEQKTIGDLLAYHIVMFSHKPITIKNAEGLLGIGTLIAKNDAGEYVKCIFGGLDGADNARHVLTEIVDATNSEVKTNAVARHAIVKRAGMEFDNSFDTEPKIQEAIAKLETHFIIVAEEQ